jgi:glycosyltransferase involved in cell wall biosynthesis
MTTRKPLVTVTIPTSNRTALLATMLRCYAEQTWPNMELIVIDDGADDPVDEAAVSAVGGRLIRLDATMLLGAKLDLAASLANGDVLVKLDDDDWVAPDFVETLVEGLLALDGGLSTPAIAGCSTFAYLLVDKWRMLDWSHVRVAGLMAFTRPLWESVPFPLISGNGTDMAAMRAAADAGHPLVRIACGEKLIVVRRDGVPGAPEHTYRTDRGAPIPRVVDRKNNRRPEAPEAMLPEWALEPLRQLRAAARVGSKATP